MPRPGSARSTTRRPSQYTTVRSTNGRSAWVQYFYGFIGGDTDQWTPYLFRNHTQIFPWIGKPSYNLTTDMADEAIKYLKEATRPRPTSRSSFTTSPAPPMRRTSRRPMDREIQGQVRHRLERSARPDLCQSEKVGSNTGEYTVGRPGRIICRSGHARMPTARKSLRGKQRCMRLMLPTPTTRSGVSFKPSTISANSYARHIYRGRQRHERRGPRYRHAVRLGRDTGHQCTGRKAAQSFTTSRVPTRRNRICPWRGHGLSTRPSNGSSRSPRISAAPARAWQMAWPNRIYN